MPSTQKSKPKATAREIKTCTRCLIPTRDWYPTTGGAKLPHVRCGDCFENEVRREVREDMPYDLVRKRERKETQLK